MSSFDNEGFFNSRVICDSLSVSGKTPDFRDRLTILVIGVSSASTHDFNRLVGIGSNADVLVGYVRINFFTSSKVAGSKEYFDLSVGRRVLRQTHWSWRRLRLNVWYRVKYSAKSYHRHFLRGRALFQRMYSSIKLFLRFFFNWNLFIKGYSVQCISNVTTTHLMVPKVMCTASSDSGYTVCITSSDKRCRHWWCRCAAPRYVRHGSMYLLVKNPFDNSTDIGS